MPEHRQGIRQMTVEDGRAVFVDEGSPLLDYTEEDREREAARAVSLDYTGDDCTVCKRPRVFLRRDGRKQCEKCETIQ